MKKVVLFILIELMGFLFITPSAEKMADVKAFDIGRFPLYFIANKGQVNEKALFYARTPGYTLWITGEGLIFDAIHPARRAIKSFDQTFTKDRERPGWRREPPAGPPKFLRDVSRLIFLNAHSSPGIIPIEEMQLRVNYFIGNDRTKWYCDIPTSPAVLYKNLYKNIDLKVYGIEKQIEYDWIVKPGANPGEIKFKYDNVEATAVDNEGNLVIETGSGKLIHKKPVSFQLVKAQGEKVDVDVRYKRIGKNTYGFEVEDYDKSRELIIDPIVLAYSTYLGGGGSDVGHSITVDDSGFVYVAGETSSTNFPTRKPYQADQGIYDVFVTKIDPAKGGTDALIYSTYLGGRGTDFGTGIAVDGKGNAYMSGYTYSTDFPTVNQYQADRDGIFTDAFVAKIDTTKNGAAGLVYSTYLGGANYEFCRKGIDIDNKGNAYVTGFTSSRDFPTRNQYQAGKDGYHSDVFVAKIDTTKGGDSSLIYSTYLGGRGNDVGIDIAVANNGRAYVIGWTTSMYYPILNYYQPLPAGKEDVFISGIDTTKQGAASLIYSTYLGGADSDYGEGIAVDNSGCVYAVGETMSSDFPTRNPYQADRDRSQSDAFVTKIDPTKRGASGLIYSTYLGGSGLDHGRDIAVDGRGSAFVTGNTYSMDFPILDHYQADPSEELSDAFVTKINTAKNGTPSLIFSTYLGGGSMDHGRGIAVDGRGCVYVTGSTNSTDFPTMNQYQGDPSGIVTDAFVAKLIPPGSPVGEITSVKPTSGPETGGNTVTIKGTNLGNGSDITSVTLCGFAAVIISQTEKQVKVTAGPGVPGTGAVVVTSLSRGTTTALDAYTYEAVIVTVPTVTTRKVTGITTCSAVSGGNVRNDGGDPVIKRGVCWSTAPNPTTADNKTKNGSGTGVFTSRITKLAENTTYYVRAYAVNSIGTSYGEEFSFITKAESVTVTLLEPQDGEEVSGFVKIKAAAASTRAETADASIMSVSKVEFYIDNTKAADFTKTPYKYTWDTTTVPDGSHTIKTIAYNQLNQTSMDEITVQVVNIPPHIELNRERLNYGTDGQGRHTGSQVVLIDNTGGGLLNWTASADAEWLSCTPASGTGAALAEVSINPTGLVPGTYKGTLTFSDDNADNSPRTLDVYLTVHASTGFPFGYFDTPVHGSIVMGNIPVTGWVLDDIDVAAVKIYRDISEGESNGNGQVYIGDALFVEGARPDIVESYPGYPKNYRAGWGYMLLTNLLPNQGNGTFTIVAKAVDKEGNTVTLAEKTIHCDNANAVKPFGAIDTPGQGCTVSGTSFVNQGWALTPLPNTIPTGGSTITVWVDGVPLGNPVYNQYRGDVAALFPGYNNRDGAGGYYYLDTTKYENGVHTIAWTAADDAGNRDGIGSRFFTILNSAQSAESKAHSAGRRAQSGHIISRIPVDFFGTVEIKKGYNTGIEPETFYPDENGNINIQIRELQRLEIRFSHSTLHLSPLPAGSFLDWERGIFYWQPGPGFIGEYQLVFVKTGLNGGMNKSCITIKIVPKFKIK